MKESEPKDIPLHGDRVEFVPHEDGTLSWQVYLDGQYTLGSRRFTDHQRCWVAAFAALRFAREQKAIADAHEP